MPAFLTGSEYLALPRDPQKWVIKDLIPVGGLTNLYGKPKTGKSYVAIGMAHAISQDAVDDWLGFPVMKHGPTAYLQIDTPRGEWASRIAAIASSGRSLDAVHFCDMLMVKHYPFNINEPEHYNWFKSELEALHPVVVFIDTIREAHAGDENDSTVMKNVVTALVAACRPAAVVLLSHSRKDTMFTANGGDDLMSDARGSSYLAGRMDCVIKMTGNEDRATGMQYKGRSAGRGRLKVTQDDETGLVIFDTEEATYHELLRGRVAAMRHADPKVSVNAMADQISSETKFRAKRSITHDINGILGIAAKPKRHTK